MKKTKILILMVTLSFPVILYLFLRSYGENQFALPIYFENQYGIFCADNTISAEDISVVNVKTGNESTLYENYVADYKIVHLPDVNDVEIQTLKNELNRVLNTFDDLSINILSLRSSADMGEDEADRLLLNESAKTYFYPLYSKQDIVDCIFAFPTAEWENKHPSEEELTIDKTLVLLDEKNRIRGYYDGYETKDVDRLILEIRVLLSNR